MWSPRLLNWAACSVFLGEPLVAVFTTLMNRNPSLNRNCANCTEAKPSQSTLSKATDKHGKPTLLFHGWDLTALMDPSNQQLMSSPASNGSWHLTLHHRHSEFCSHFLVCGQWQRTLAILPSSSFDAQQIGLQKVRYVQWILVVMIQWWKMVAKIPLLAKWDNPWQCLSQMKDSSCAALCAILLLCKEESRVLVRGCAHGQSTWYWFHLQAKNHCNGPPKVYNWHIAPQKHQISTIFTKPLLYDVNNKCKVLEQAKRDNKWPNSALEFPWSLTVFVNLAVEWKMDQLRFSGMPTQTELVPNDWTFYPTSAFGGTNIF